MDYKEAYDAMAVVMGTDQTAQGEAGGEWECVTCGHNALAYPVTEPEYCRSLGHDVRRVEGKA